MLELELGKYLKITIANQEEEESDAKSKKNQSHLIMKLFDKNAPKVHLVQKIIRWPIGQTVPYEIEYNVQNEVVVLKGKSTKADIPLSKATIDKLTTICVAKLATKMQNKTYASFAVNPVETFDSSTILKSVTNVIESPHKEKRWSNLINILKEMKNGEIVGSLSGVEQDNLLQAAQKYTRDEDSNQELVRSLLEVLIESRIFTFKNEDILLRLCVEKQEKSLIEKIMNDTSRIVSENVLVEFFKLATKSAEKTEKIEKILERSFSKLTMTEAAAELLSTSEVIEIMEVLVDIYKGFGNNHLAGKALTMIALLMDSHGSRIVNEHDLHQRFAAISNFIIEIQSLIGKFACIESCIAENLNEDSGRCTVRRVQLVQHKLAW